MNRPIQLLSAVLFAMGTPLGAQEHKPASHEQKVGQRIAGLLKPVQSNPDYYRNGYLIIWQDNLALLLLHKKENIDEANRLILAYCERERKKIADGGNVTTRCEGLLRAGLMERSRKLLTPEARTAIEDYASDLVNKHNRGITAANADERFFKDWKGSENHYLNDRRRYYLSLQVLRMSERFGPKTIVGNRTIDAQCKAWEAFWIRYFHDRANEGTDGEIAHPAGYGACTIGVYYDLYDFGGSAALRELAGNFLTLFWADVAGEFDPSIGQRAGVAALRAPGDGPYGYWAWQLLYSYGWHDNIAAAPPYYIQPVQLASFYTSSYRPPEILSAIAHATDRGSYLSTSRRALLAPEDAKASKDFIVFDRNGDSHFRRDVFYTPDYALSTMTMDPTHGYRGVIAQALGVTMAGDWQGWIKVDGRGGSGERAVNGITGPGVSIIARDPRASIDNGGGKYASQGTHLFIPKGQLWDHAVEDTSGWFFTRSGNAYVALRVAGEGYEIKDTTFVWTGGGKVPGKFEEAVSKDGRYLVFKDMWAPVVIQMGRAADYKSFEAFQTSVKTRKLEYENGKLTYESEAKDSYEYWAKGAQLPKINGTTVNLNPTKTYDSPFLSMEHGSNKAVIHYSGYKDEVLDFGGPANPGEVKAQDAK